MTVVGRLAPSPTGSLHVGNVRTFLWAWLSARARGGKVLLRVEDLDTPRLREGVVPKILDDLLWLGFDWDGDVAVQSERRERYKAAFEKLAGRLYPCKCTRGDIAAAQSAPHEGDQEPHYPGTCRDNKESGIAWRLRVDPGRVEFVDRLYGPQSIDVAGTVGDFVVAKTSEQPLGWNLAAHQHHFQAFGSGEQYFGEFFLEGLFFGCRGIAGTGSNAPGQTNFVT